MKNGIFTTDWAAVGDALITAVLFAILGAFGAIVLAGNFDLFTANWVMIGHTMANVGFIAGVSSLVQDFLKTNTGSLFGLTPPNAQ